MDTCSNLEFQKILQGKNPRTQSLQGAASDAERKGDRLTQERKGDRKGKEGMERVGEIWERREGMEREGEEGTEEGNGKGEGDS